MLALGAAAPRQAGAQPAADAARPGSLLTRDKLGSDWGGLRGAIDHQGLRFDFWGTGFYQDLLSAEGNDEGGFSGRVDLMINADTGKLGLWQGGGFHVHATYRGGALLPVHTSGLFPLGGKGEVVATSLYLSQRLDESTRLMFGKINAIDLLASHPFFGGWGTDLFRNVASSHRPAGSCRRSSWGASSPTLSPRTRSRRWCSTPTTRRPATPSTACSRTA